MYEFAAALSRYTNTALADNALSALPNAPVVPESPRPHLHWHRPTHPARRPISTGRIAV